MLIVRVHDDVLVTSSCWTYAVLHHWILMSLTIVLFICISLSLFCWSSRKSIWHVQDPFWRRQQLVNWYLFLLVELLDNSVEFKISQLTIYMIRSLNFADIWRFALGARTLLRMHMWVFLFDDIFDLLYKMVRTLVREYTYTFLKVREHFPDKLITIRIDKHCLLWVSTDVSCLARDHFIYVLFNDSSVAWANGTELLVGQILCVWDVTMVDIASCIRIKLEPVHVKSLHICSILSRNLMNCISLKLVLRPLCSHVVNLGLRHT